MCIRVELLVLYYTIHVLLYYTTVHVKLLLLTIIFYECQFVSRYGKAEYGDRMLHDTEYTVLLTGSVIQDSRPEKNVTTPGLHGILL